MHGNKSIGVAIPCFKTGEITIEVVKDILDYVDHVVLIDDNCPYRTGDLVEKVINSKKLHIIRNEINSGVGASTKKGFEWLLRNKCDLILKIDGDGQMKATDIPKMYLPIINNECEATKGNRFNNISQLKNMPILRLIGNIILSFIAKFSTGYWELFDATNGFIALDSKVLKKLPLKKIDDRFFFETDFLFRCGLNNVLVKNVSVDSYYNNVSSSLNPIKEIPNFFIKNCINSIKRIAYQYFLYKYNLGSIELIISFLFAISSLLMLITSLLVNNLSSKFLSDLWLIIFLLFLSLIFYLFFLYYDIKKNILSRKKN